MIGSNLLSTIFNLNLKYRIVAIDNLSRGKLSNIPPHILQSIEFRHCDLAYNDSWAFDLSSDDIIIHIADIVAGIGYVFENEWSVFRTNILINSNIAKIVTLNNPYKLIYLGTACSYPDFLQQSLSDSGLIESDKFPASPESGYGWSKLIGEIEFKLCTKSSSTKLITLDLHNVYGWPCTYSDSTSQVIPALIYKSITSKDGVLEVWGDGSQGRAFVHADDVSFSIINAIEYSGGESTFMIGPNHCNSIKEIAEIIISHPDIKISSLIFDTSKPTGDIGRFSLSTLSYDVLGWKPSVDIKSGIYGLIENIKLDYSNGT